MQGKKGIYCSKKSILKDTLGHLFKAFTLKGEEGKVYRKEGVLLRGGTVLYIEKRFLKGSSKLEREKFSRTGN